MPINVLVSGAGGDVGQGVLRALSASRLDVKCYTTCISKHSAGLYMGARGFLAPLSNDESYVPFLINLIKKLGINSFFPTVDGEIKKIAKEKSHIEAETGAFVFVDDLKKVSITDDKLENFRYLQERNFPCPHSISADSPDLLNFVQNYGFPVVVKRRVGRGGQEVVIAKSFNQIEPVIGDSSFMLQEWLDPVQGEFTSGFYIGDDGEIKGDCTFQRKLRGGSTIVAQRIIDRDLEGPLEEIAVSLGMKYLNIQSMRRGGVLVPFEFNGRLSGTTSIVSKIFNAPEMFIREKLLGEKLYRINNTERFVAMRYYDEVYASFDEVDQLVARSVGA